MYKKYLTYLPAGTVNKSIFFSKQTFLLILAYFAIRFFSFLLAGHLVLQAMVVFIIIMAFGIIYYKNQELAWYILLGELLLGGAGHFFEFFGLSLRTILLITFASLWIITAISNNRKKKFHFPHKLFYLLMTLFVFVGIASIIGLINQHGLKAVVQDLIPYSLFILVLPTYYLLKKQSGQEYLIRLIISFVISSAIFSIITFILFSSGIEVLQSPYYKWFRDVAMGKITDMGNGFFRIVTPSNLLITPIVLLISSLLMKKEKHHKLWWVILSLSILILVLNFSRIYLLALAIGLLILKYKHSWKKWIYVNTIVILSFIILFSGISFIASSGSSFGQDLLGFRISSLTNPKNEVSSLTRMTLLEPITMMIKQHPIIGSGLGSRIIFIDPVKNTQTISPHFDWGYLELWVELGLFGLISFMTLVFYIIYSLVKKIRSISDYHDFYVGVLAGIISLLIMNITSPILFHTLGIFYLVFIIVISAKHHSILDKIITLLYRTFHKLKKPSA